VSEKAQSLGNITGDGAEKLYTPAKNSLKNAENPTMIINISGRVLRLRARTIATNTDAHFRLRKFIRFHPNINNGTLEYVEEMDVNGQFYFERPPIETDIIADYVMLGEWTGWSKRRAA
jgi:hypothetical protein